MSRPTATARLRADARRNREQVLRAARDLFIERGLDVPLEDVARRAEVGIGTLYRRFRDRRALVAAVLIDALDQARASAVRAGQAEGNGLDAIARYLHEMIEVRVSAVIPLALDHVDDSRDLIRVREASARAVERLIHMAHRDGSLARTVTFGDVATLLVRFSRPLPGAVPRQFDTWLAHRHLDLALAGLRAGVTPPDEPGPTRAELRRRSPLRALGPDPARRLSHGVVPPPGC